MLFGISGAPLSTTLRYAGAIGFACDLYDIPPKLAYAIAYVESIRGEIIGLWPSAAAVLSADGGSGLFQLTPPPAGIIWADPIENAKAACAFWILGALGFWSNQGFTGETLVRLVADEFNEGRTAAWAWHLRGNADGGTTGSDYGHRVLVTYQALIAGEALPAI